MLWVLHFLSVRYRLHSASLIFPEFQRVDSNNCKSGKGENTETGETFKWWYSLETGSYILLKEICIKMSFEFFNRTGATTQVEDGNFRLNTRFLEHSSFAFPPANQKKKKKVTNPAALTPNIASCFWGPVMTILVGLLFGSCLFHL